jgi:hypothetical protein
MLISSGYLIQFTMGGFAIHNRGGSVGDSANSPKNRALQAAPPRAT